MATKSILIVNPNTTRSMTESLRPLVAKLNFENASYTFFTAPVGVTSINNEEDANISAEACLQLLLPITYDAVLIACYSVHPLVSILRTHTRSPVLGIFEASVTTSLNILAIDQTFGIVSTGKIWERLLTDGVHQLLGSRTERFAGVETTGLTATELHDAPPEIVRQKMVEATRRLVGKGNVGAVCLGCAGMAGMDEIVRSACIEELGEEKGKLVHIVDGVVAGVAALEGLVRSGF